MKPTRHQLKQFVAILVAFAAGFAAHAVWPTKAQAPLSESEARLVGTWQQYFADGSGQLDKITFLPNRKVLLGNGGMEALWAIQNGKLVVHSYHSDGTDWGRTNEGHDLFTISFAGTSDRLEIDGGAQARATLVREL